MEMWKWNLDSEGMHGGRGMSICMGGKMGWFVVMVLVLC